jgi:ribosomal protein S18 acetylase RimI-like enzyme
VNDKMCAPVNIRSADATDAEALHGMVVALAKFTGHEHRVSSTVEDFRRLGFAEPPAFQSLIAEQNGTAVGLCLFFYQFSSWRGRLGIYIQDLYVDPAQRGSGLGRRLVAETVRYGKQQGADHLRLSVDVENAPAQGFYQGLGMVRRDDEYIFQLAEQAFESLAAEGVNLTGGR